LLKSPQRIVGIKVWRFVRVLNPVYSGNGNRYNGSSSDNARPSRRRKVNTTMQLLTDEQGERAIRVDLFEETVRFTPSNFITLTHPDGTFNYYVLGEAIQHENSWIVPLYVVPEADEADARRTGTIAHFAEGKDGELA
jgi:hypothetical protein